MTQSPAWRILLQAKPFLKKRRKLVFLTILFASLAAATAFGLPFTMMKLTNLAVAGEASTFNRYLVLGLGLLAVDFVVVLVWKRSGLRLSAFLTHDLRMQISEHLQKICQSVLEQYHSGDLAARAGENVSALTSYLVFVAEFIYQPLKLVAAMVFIGMLNWKMLAFLVVIVPFATPLYERLSRPLEKYFTRIRESQGQAGALVEDVLRGMYVLKAFNLQGPLSEKYARLMDQVKNGRLLAERQQAFLMLTGAFIRFLPLLLGYVLAGYLAFRGELSVGGLMALINLNWAAISSYEAILTLIGQTRETIPAAERVFALFDLPEEIPASQYKDKTLILRRTAGAPAVSFSHVRFGYGEDNPILDELSFEIQEGETVALVGASGCGKSTIMRLICGFHSPLSGSIRLYGQELGPDSLASAREEMTLVTQETYLFPITIAENLRMGRLDVSDEEMVAAAKAANAHIFITRLPDGYQTVIQEGAVNLSGGQKQCLSIARSLIKNAPLLLLDEPTASLDAQSEADVQQALSHLTKGRTVLVIAHRLASIRSAQRILVLEKGRIVEMGTHDQLMSQASLYRRLYIDQLQEKQAGQYTNPPQEVFA